MTPADRAREVSERPTEEAAALSETFVLLDNNSGAGPPSLLFTEPLDIVVAWTPQEVPARWRATSADDQRFLMVQAKPSSQLNLVQNWFDEVRRLVPMR